MPGPETWSVDAIHEMGLEIKDLDPAFLDQMRQQQGPTQLQAPPHQPGEIPLSSLVPQQYPPHQPGEGVTDEPTRPNHRGRNVMFGAFAGLVAVAAVAVVMKSGAESSTAADTVAGKASTAHSGHPNKPHGKPPAGTTTSKSSESPSASSSANTLAPVTPDFKFTSPGCDVTKVHYVNKGLDPKGHRYHSFVPLDWKFMEQKGSDIAPSPYAAVGLLSGNLLLKACVDTSAIQYDKAASSRLDGKPVFTIDTSVTEVTPDDNHLHNAIALAGSIDTDTELLAAMQANNPKATMDDVAAFHANTQAYEKQVENLDLMIALRQAEKLYTTALLNNYQQYIKNNLRQQFLAMHRDPNSAVLVPSVSSGAGQTFTYNVNKIPKDQYTGPFSAVSSLVKLSMIVTDTATGKQLPAEPQP